MSTTIGQKVKLCTTFVFNNKRYDMNIKEAEAKEWTRIAFGKFKAYLIFEKQLKVIIDKCG